MQRKLLGAISVDFDATVQLLIIYSEFVKYEGWNFNSGNYLFTTDTK